MKRWFHRVNHLTLHSLNSLQENDYIKPLSAFQLKQDSKTLLKGFYMLELNLTKPSPKTFSILSSGHKGNSGSLDQSFIFLLSSKVTTKRVVYISSFASHFHWELNAEFDSTDVSSFKLSKISERFAKRLMAKKLIANGWDAELLSDHNLTELYQQYDSIFSGVYSKTIQYKNWIKYSESFSELLKNQGIKISIVMPVYNPDLEYLTQAIESVIAQSYSNWELCIADDDSSDQQVRDLIVNYANIDNRIKYEFRTENGNISAASNTALSMATGEYVALLDHDDTLSPYALNEVVIGIRESDAKIIYSDEDKINELGERFDPHFKSDFNFELILSHNYISHLGVYHKALIDQVGGFREGYEGAQDYDLLLRCLLHISPSDIKHLSKILYHWRAIEGSTAYSSSQKSYTSLAGLKALKDAVQKMNKSWQVEHGVLDNTYRVIRSVEIQPKISIIIPTKDQADLLKTCIDSVISQTEYLNYEIVVVNNGSVESKTKVYLSGLKSVKNIRVLDYPKPFNYSAINNFAVSKCDDSDYVLLLNNDIAVINGGWLTEMLSIAQQQDVGCVGAKLYYSNDLIQHAGVILGIGGVAGHSHKYFPSKENGYFSRLQLRQDISAVTAACLLVRKSIYEKVNGLNEKDLTIAFNDVDFCLRVRELGLRNVWTPFAELYHYESISRGAEDTPEKVKRFNQEVAYMKDRWGERLNSDPYYNENLTLQYEDFSIKAAQ
jgi:glycosyltransferase involved in cell wall biosynthesis